MRLRYHVLYTDGGKMGGGVIVGGSTHAPSTPLRIEVGYVMFRKYWGNIFGPNVVSKSE